MDRPAFVQYRQILILIFGTVSKNEIAVTFCVDIQKLMYIIKRRNGTGSKTKIIQGEEKWERTMSIWKYQNRS